MAVDGLNGQIRNRRELVEVLSAAMANAYSQLRENQRLLFGQNLLKTYLLELDGEASSTWPQSLGRAEFQIWPSEDHDLVTASRDSKTYLIFDRLGDRFVVCHSLARAHESDLAVERLASTSPFDTLWLSSELLQTVARMGALRGFTTRFDRSSFVERPKEVAPMLLPKDESLDLAELSAELAEVDTALPDLVIDETLPVESLKLRLWGSEALGVLHALRAQEALDRAVAVAGVRLRYFAKAANFFCLDEIDYKGRITSRGNSYELHRTFVGRILDRYRSRLEHIERFHRIEHTESGTVSGEPLVMRLDSTLSPDQLMRVVFSGTQPFRLLGVPRYIDDDYATVAAIDLHGGHFIDFEIAPELVRIYLREGGCANSLLRLESNLQRHLDARVTLEPNTAAEVT